MKLYKDIRKQIIKNDHTIESLTNKIIELEKRNEIKAAINAGDLQLARDLHVERENTLDMQRKLSEKILFLQVENRILQDNGKAALFAEYLPIIQEILKPYENKPYGDKTRDKIRAAAHEKGFWFYFDGRMYIKIGFLNSAGYNDYTMPEIEIQTKYNTPFIDADNKIHFSGLDISIYEKYVDDISGRAKSILKAFKAYKEQVEKAKTLETALNNLLPCNMSSFRKINDVYELFRG